MDVVRLAVIGGILLVVGGVAVAVGILPAPDALAVADRVWPILLFVVAITIVAELAAVAGVFDVAADFLARLARGRTWLLWLLVVILAVVVTSFLSLDTTAVLLTPVVVAVARAHRLDALPFAFTTVWLANTASLVLPVSNLTNLLAVERLDIESADLRADARSIGADRDRRDGRCCCGSFIDGRCAALRAGAATRDLRPSAARDHGRGRRRACCRCW